MLQVLPDRVPRYVAGSLPGRPVAAGFRGGVLPQEAVACRHAGLGASAGVAGVAELARAARTGGPAMPDGTPGMPAVAG